MYSDKMVIVCLCKVFVESCHVVNHTHALLNMSFHGQQAAIDFTTYLITLLFVEMFIQVRARCVSHLPNASALFPLARIHCS